MEMFVNKLFGSAGSLLRRSPAEMLRGLWMAAGIPVLALVLFVAAWGAVAPSIQTSLGAVPGPVQVAEQAQVLWNDHFNERRKRGEFYERQDARNKERLATRVKAMVTQGKTLEQIVAAKPLREYDEEWGKFRKTDSFVEMVYYGFVPYKQK